MAQKTNLKGRVLLKLRARSQYQALLLQLRHFEIAFLGESLFKHCYCTVRQLQLKPRSLNKLEANVTFVRLLIEDTKFSETASIQCFDLHCRGKWICA